MDTTQLKLGESPGVTAPGGQTVGSTMKETHKTKRVRQTLVDALASFHRDDSGVAMTEYIIVFTLISFGATIALIGTAAYIKGYRDFMVWWLGHPAV